MKTYTSTLLVLALANAAYGRDHSPKASKERDISMSIDVAPQPDFSVLSKSAKSAKSAKKAKSDQSRRVLQVDEPADMDESMSVNIDLFLSKSRKFSIDSKSAKKASSSDDAEASPESKSSKDEEATVESKSSKDEEATIDSKSSKEAKSFKPEPRSVDPLKAQSYIEYTRAQVPESANAPTDGSSGAMTFGVATSLSVFIAASAVAMN